MNPMDSMKAALVAGQPIPLDRAPMPQARPQMQQPVQQAPMNPTVPEPRPTQPIAPPSENPIMRLFNPETGRNRIRAIGAGMANVKRTDGDPFMAFGSGFGGATNHYTARDNDKRIEDTRQSNWQAEQDRLKANNAADMELRKAAADREERRTRLAERRTAAEIKAESRKTGVPTSKVLDAEKRAHEAVARIRESGGPNGRPKQLTPEEADQIYNENYSRIMEMYEREYGVAEPSRSGLSQGGLSSPRTIVDGQGNRMIVKDGEWVPLED